MQANAEENLDITDYSRHTNTTTVLLAESGYHLLLENGDSILVQDGLADFWPLQPLYL
jgi:hypothetical protein